MAWKPFITNIISLTGAAESGARVNSYVRGTTTPLALATDAAGTPATNPVVADSLGQVTAYYDDSLEYSFATTTADEATSLWQLDLTAGVITSLTFNTSYDTHPLINATWVPALGVNLADGWVEKFQNTPDFETEYVTPAGAGNDSLPNITAAIAAAGAGGVVSLMPGADYELSSNIAANLDNQAFLVPATSSLTLQSGGSQPIFRVSGNNFLLYGHGKLDCAGVSSGVNVTGYGFKTGGCLEIVDSTGRAVNITDGFDPDYKVELRGLRVYWTSVGVAAVGMTVTPLAINLQGDLAVDVEELEFDDVEVDFRAFTVQQIAEMGYPTSGNPNSMGIRVNQSGTGVIKETVRFNSVRILYPEATDSDLWNPDQYGHAADGAGRRRPTGIEMKTTATNGVKRGSMKNVDVIGGALGVSLGSLDDFFLNGTRCDGQTDYCYEFGSGRKVHGVGVFAGGQNAGKPISVTNMTLASLPGVHVIGPADNASGFPSSVYTAISSESVDCLNIPGSTFEATTANIAMLRLNGGTQTVNASGSVFHGNGVTGAKGVEVHSGTVTDLDLSNCVFVDVAGYSIDVVSGGAVTNLRTIGITGDNAGGFNNSGTVTNHFDGFSSGVSGLKGRELALTGLEFDAASIDIDYNGAAVWSLRSTHFLLSAGTSDASDTRYFDFCGGGSSGQYRGGTLTLGGNENGTYPGLAKLQSGYNRDIILDAAGTLGETIFQANGSEIARFNTSGNFALVTGKVITIDGDQVVAGRVVNADLANTPNSGDATTDDLIAALVAVITTHGLGASS